MLKWWALSIFNFQKEWIEIVEEMKKSLLLFITVTTFIFL